MRDEVKAGYPYLSYADPLFRCKTSSVYCEHTYTITPCTSRSVQPLVHRSITTSAIVGSLRLCAALFHKTHQRLRLPGTSRFRGRRPFVRSEPLYSRLPSTALGLRTLDDPSSAASLLASDLGDTRILRIGSFSSDRTAPALCARNTRYRTLQHLITAELDSGGGKHRGQSAIHLPSDVLQALLQHINASIPSTPAPYRGIRIKRCSAVAYGLEGEGAADGFSSSLRALGTKSLAKGAFTTGRWSRLVLELHAFCASYTRIMIIDCSRGLVLTSRRSS